MSITLDGSSLTIEKLEKIAGTVPQPFQKLMYRFWPGPLTLIFPGAQNISSLLTGPTNTIGIRISSHPVAIELCRKWSKPVTATSANISGHPPATCADEIIRYFGDKIDLIIDGGVAATPQCSTIATVEGDRLRVIRSGMIEIKTD